MTPLPTLRDITMAVRRGLTASQRKRRAAVHGDADQDPITEQDVALYFAEARKVLAVDTPEGAAAVTAQHAEMVAGVAARIEALEGRGVKGANVSGLRRLLHAVEHVHPHDAAVLVGSFGLLLEREPARFRSARAVSFQLLRHMEGLADASGAPVVQRNRVESVTTVAAGAVVATFKPILARFAAAG